MLRDCPGLEVRVAAGVDYMRFVADEFDADIVYGPPLLGSYGRPAQRKAVVLPLGTGIATPHCPPVLAVEIRSPSDLLRMRFI